MKGYKVVRKIEEKYFSCWVKGKLAVEYKIGEWVTPSKKEEKRGYGLTFFALKSDATMFHRLNEDFLSRDWVIFKVEVEKAFPSLPGYKSISRDQSIRKPPNVLYDGWPDGTKMAKKIKLIKEIKEAPSH